MPFRKNVERENTLLKHWHQGETVKVASLFTGIPEGTVSHYYARFSRKRDVYGKKSEKGYQEPPRTSPLDAAFANVSFANAYSIVNQLVGAGDYARARDYLQTILLLHDLEKLMLPIAQNVDPKKSNEVLQYMALLTKMTTGATPTEKKAEPTESSPRTAATTGSD
jgi:hypothetical protein